MILIHPVDARLLCDGFVITGTRFVEHGSGTTEVDAVTCAPISRAASRSSAPRQQMATDPECRRRGALACASPVIGSMIDACHQPKSTTTSPATLGLPHRRREPPSPFAVKLAEARSGNIRGHRHTRRDAPPQDHRRHHAACWNSSCTFVHSGGHFVGPSWKPAGVNSRRSTQHVADLYGRSAT